MKLYFKRKAFGVDDNIYCLADISGKKIYDWKIGGFFGKKIRIFDADQNEVAVVRQVLKSLMPKYQVFIRDEPVLEIRKEFHAVLPKYTVTGLGWEMENKLMLFDYGIKKAGEQVLTVRRTDDPLDWATHTYELDIADPKDEVAAVAAAVTINCGIEAEHFIRKPSDR